MASTVPLSAVCTLALLNIFTMQLPPIPCHLSMPVAFRPPELC
jgi:hypothetical protein